MYEVGKKYKRIYDGVLWDDALYECLWTDGKFMTVRLTDSGHSPFTYLCTEFKQYKEPVVNKYTLSVVRSETTVRYGLLVSQSVRHRFEDNILGDVEFTLTDGKLTDVKLLG